MREFRLVYNSPRRTDRLGEPGNVLGRIHVRVQPCSARAGEAVLLPLSDGPAYRARLAGICGVDIGHAQSNAFSLIGNEVLELPKRPAVQSGPDSLTGLEVGSDMRQILHADFAGPNAQRLRNDGLAGFVVHMGHVPTLVPGDSLELALGCAATVGLETTAMGKVAVTLVPQLPAAEYLATTRGGEIVFPDIHTQYTTIGDREDLGEFQYEVKIPMAFSVHQLRFLGATRGQQVGLVLAADERHDFPTTHGEQGNAVFPERIGPMVEMDSGAVERDAGDWFVPGNPPVRLQCFIGAGDTVNGVAGHLAPKIREAFPKEVVGEMVQCYPVPAAMFLGEWYCHVAGLRENHRQSIQFPGLRRGGQQLQGNSTFHIGKYATKIASTQGDAGLGQALPAALSPPGLNAGV